MARLPVTSRTIRSGMYAFLELAGDLGVVAQGEILVKKWF